MRTVKGYISRWEERMAQHEVFSLLRRDTRLERVLDFIPEAATFWIMLFQDIIKLNGRRVQDPRLRFLVQRHASEDYGHDSWYLEDLNVIFPGRSWDVAWLFSREGIVFREAALEVTSELFRPLDDRLRVVFVEAIEATSQVFFPLCARHLAECGLGEGLKFFAGQHLKVEDDHALFEEQVERELNAIVLPLELRSEALCLVDRVFEAFMRMGDAVVQRMRQQDQSEGGAPRETFPRRMLTLPRPDAIAGQTFRSFGEAKLRGLCEALELGEETALMMRLFQKMTGSWGERPIGRVPRWPSEVADDYSPMEFSIAFGGPQPELRLLVEPQGSPLTTLESSWAAGKELNASLQREFGVSLERFERLEDLFVPKDPQASFALAYAVGVKPGTAPDVKLYLNPNARGPEQAPELVREMMERLGLAPAWKELSEGVLLRQGLDSLLYTSVDLAQRNDARAKVYTQHREADAEHLERVLECAPGYERGQARAICDELLGTRGPFMKRPLLTTFSFISRKERPYGATLHVPIRAYLDNDALVLERVSRQLAPADRQRLERAVAAIADRPLAQGVGLHSHVSFRWQGGQRTMTVYLSVEAYAVTAARGSSAGAERPPVVRSVA